MKDMYLWDGKRLNYFALDTIDLQDQDAPSAKDHSRHPVTGRQGSPAPHQADALRHVELELSEQHGRSPRHSQDLSGKELQLLHDEEVAHEQDPSHNLLSNSVQNGMEEEMQGEDGDESLDDDMIDKISSSPSIGEDGGYTLPLVSPLPGPSFPHFYSAKEAFPKVPQGPPSGDFLSSSPYTETPVHSPLLYLPDNADGTLSKDHHHQHGKYSKEQTVHLPMYEDSQSEQRDQVSPIVSAERALHLQDPFRASEDCCATDFDPNDFRHLLLPASDPLLGDEDLEDDAMDGFSSEIASPANSSSSWEDEATGENDDDDDDTEDISFVEDDRFVDSGWGGECLRELEEIDFDFVYALHTFVATVEGQANATKGDTMVLLDDSNSYWWLVRVVKDSSIGYLPAEHIETPTERLARLNKHRNLDLSQTMLTDQEEDRKANSLNPLKKAMRRRNVKTVQFAPPTYVEPSDYGASSDEEEEGGDEATLHGEDGAEAHSQVQTRNGMDGPAIDPLATRDVQINGRGDESAMEQEHRERAREQATGPEKSRTSDEFSDHADDNTAAKSRKGTVRNTDSFFRDDGVETRKINLTPSLLRDDSNTNLSRSSEATLVTRASLESLEKDGPPEKGKEKKEKKEKRGMLGGMFKRKDKKDKKAPRDEADEGEKTSSEISRQSPQPKESMESLSNEAARYNQQPHRQTGKLQKQPPPKLSPKSSYTKEPSLTAQKPASEDKRDKSPLGSIITAEPTGPNIRTGPSVDLQATPSLEVRPSGQSLQTEMMPAEPNRAPPPPLGGASLSVRAVQPSLPEAESLRQQQQKPDDIPSPLALQARQLPQEDAIVSRSSEDKGRSVLGSTLNTTKPTAPSPQPVRGQHRMALDDFDTPSPSDSEAPTTEPSSERVSHEQSGPETTNTSVQHPHLAVAQAAQHEGHESRAPDVTAERSRERLSESPIEVPHPNQTKSHPSPAALNMTQERTTPHQPPPLVTDTSSSEHTSPLSPHSESPSLIEVPDAIAPTDNPVADRNPISSTTPLNASTTTNPTISREDHNTLSSTSTTPTWSDASLRAYLDSDDSDIRDLLLVVHDKTGVVPRRDHPLIKNLYKEENEKLDAISSDLDGLLNGYLARKGRAQSAR